MPSEVRIRSARREPWKQTVRDGVSQELKARREVVVIEETAAARNESNSCHRPWFAGPRKDWRHASFASFFARRNRVKCPWILFGLGGRYGTHTKKVRVEALEGFAGMLE